MRGRFLVLEGLDGAGTTTQTARLQAWLEGRGRRVHPTREPSTGPVGRLIRETLRAAPDAPAPSTLPWMFAADRADHLAREIEPALAAGVDVISDRYAPSSLAYQSVERDLDEVWALNASFRVPDLTLFVTVPVDEAMRRIGGRAAAREIFEEHDRLEAVARQYDRVIDRLRARGDRLAVIDGSRPVDEVTAAVVAAVEALP